MIKKYEINIDKMKFSANKGELLLFSLLENSHLCLGNTNGRLRGGFCGMGVCQECLVMVNGKEALACQTYVEDDLKVETNG